jgi:isoleucyl-tRNA synthetase
MPYSTALNTPLANFEAKMPDCYKDRQDPTVIVTFPIDGDTEGTCFLAWTTTPWTLPSNLALCVNGEMDYVKVKDKDDGRVYICGKDRVGFVFPGKKKKKKNCAKDDKKVAEETDRYLILETFKGKTLKGKRYTPLFQYFEQRKERGNFVVLVDDYVTASDGTMIVHQAPGFGEDDQRVCLRDGVLEKDEWIPCPVDEYGRFTDHVKEFQGQYVLDANRHIVKALEAKGRLHEKSSITHSYPHCWRSDTPLIYRAIPSWFVRVERIRDKIIVNNNRTYWIPDNIRLGRFHNWLANARDWAVSRNRYWGTPLPIWQSEDGKETVVIGSVAELEELSGIKDITDLHRETVDDIIIPSREGRGDLKRIPEVFDCWFESGSMPYGQMHYPFENVEKFEKGFPADFVAEGLDQTRGWFYTLMVLSTALFDKPAFKNLIVNGMVLAEDGKKMSKRLKNYPAPQLILDRYGADALRLYLITSPVVRAQELRFKESGVRDVIKDVFLPWWNSYNFFLENVQRMETTQNCSFVYDSEIHQKTSNILDRWILSKFQSLIAHVRREMGGDEENKEDHGYRLYNVTPGLLRFISQLSHWYVRMNKARMKGSLGLENTQHSLQTLYYVLFNLTRVMAPFTPFIVETMFQNLRRCQKNPEGSVHFLQLPSVRDDLIDGDIERRLDNFQKAVNLGRNCRDKCPFPVKQPCPTVVIVNEDKNFLADVESLAEYVKTEVNVKEVAFSSQFGDYITLVPNPNRASLGRKFKREASKIYKACLKLTHQQLEEFRETGLVDVLGHALTADDLEIDLKFSGDSSRYVHSADGGVLVLVDWVLTDELKDEGIAVALKTKVQMLRKHSGLVPADVVDVFFESDTKVTNIISVFSEYLKTTLRSRVLPMAEYVESKYNERGRATSTVDEHEVTVILAEKSNSRIE